MCEAPQKSVKFVLFACSALALVSCSSDKTVLSGERQDLFVVKKLDTTSIENKTINLALPKNKINFESFKTFFMDHGNKGGHFLFAAPIVIDDKIVTLDSHGIIKVFYKESAELFWSYNPFEGKVPSMGGGISATNNGKIIATFGDGTILCVDLAQKKELWGTSINTPIRSAPSFIGDTCYVQAANFDVYAFDVKTGAKLWSYIESSVEPSRVMQGSQMVVMPDSIIVAYPSGLVNALNPQTGSLKWTTSLQNATQDMHYVVSKVFIKPLNGHLYVFNPFSGLEVLDAKTGAHVWSYSIETSQEPLIVDHYLFGVDLSRRQLWCLDILNKEIMWRVDLPSHDKWYTPIINDGQFILFSQSGHVLSIDPKNGQTLSQITSHKHDVVLPPVSITNTILLTSSLGTITYYS